ncbi:WAT1-related protein At5g64700-like [Asparagus officinalis]|uniref:WAT1-related protein At5g64700-like n=1 Tax=Asparagus officinalis TaxID=4686 RepID=UPI00098E0A87|nr:WAT1-related protein At5g64700-like [Asparagus officinalis]
MGENKPYLAMIIVQIIFAGMSMISKAAFNGGMNTFVFVFYRQAIAAVILLPLAIIFARKTAPPLPFKLMFKIFMLALFGYTVNLNMHSIAINLTSATVNLIPVFTFIIALLFREEIIRLRTFTGIAKAIGILICFTGVMIIAFYKDRHSNPFINDHQILHGSNQNRSHTSMNRTWIIGTFLMILVAFCWALWFVLQGLLLKEYPSWIWSSALVSMFSALQCFVVANIAVERNVNKWKLHWDGGLLAVVYNGVLVAGLVLYLQTWCIHKKGPVFVGMFFPLALVVTIIASSFIIEEVVSPGSIVGGAFMVVGLYSVLWGKSEFKC